MSITEEHIIEEHPFEPFLPKHAKLLMLGSFPPQEKRWKMKFYYPNFNNDMWRIFGLIYFNDANHFIDTEQKLFKETELVFFLNTIGVALYDTAEAVIRLQGNAADKDLEVVRPTDVDALLNKLPLCRAIVTTGQTATDTICLHYGINHLPKVGDYTEFSAEGRAMKLYRLPSSSRAYPMKLEKKAAFYKEMLNEIGL